MSDPSVTQNEPEASSSNSATAIRIIHRFEYLVVRYGLLGDYDALGVCATLISLQLFGVLVWVLLQPLRDPIAVAGHFILAEGISCVATLILVFGMRRLFGPTPWIENIIATRWRRVFLFVGMSGWVVILAWIGAIVCGIR